MTDDFQLFADPGGGDPAVDADIALLAAYVARELSLVQIVAVEERLATDVAFRDKASPILEGWFLAGSFGSTAPTMSTATVLTPTEIEGGWQRYLLNTDSRQTNTHAGPMAREYAGSTTHRRRSMSRIAAVVAVVVLPMIAVAQLAVYVANHAEAPGHALARAVVPVAFQEPITPPIANQMPVRRPETPVVRELTLAPRDTRQAVAGTTTSVTVPPALRGTPDRARIEALVKEHQAGVVRGDSAADYVVIVVDAADKYVWSTHGVGSVMIEVGADTRTAQARATYRNQHRAQFYGPNGQIAGMMAPFRNNTPLYVVDGKPIPAYGGITVDSIARLNISSVELIRGAPAAALYGSRAQGGVIEVTTQRYADSVARARQRGQDQQRDTARSQIAGRLGATPNLIAERMPLPGGAAGMAYTVGWGPASAPVNQANGLQESGRGESGIKGLASTSVSANDLYAFGVRELAPQNLRVMVVQLTPGTTFKGR